MPPTCRFPRLGALHDVEFTPIRSSALVVFLQELFASGDVRVPSCEEDAGEVDEAAVVVLRECDRLTRAELAGEAPELDMEAAGWAARKLFNACQCLVDRDVDEDALRALLASPCPSAIGPRTTYAVDLVFRFLPDLLVLSRRLAPNDALTGILEEWAREWPLSSTGVTITGSLSLDGFMQHPALRRLYLDRIATLNAKDRLNAPEVRDALRAELEAHPSLAPLMWEALRPSAASITGVSSPGADPQRADNARPIDSHP